MSVRPNSIRYVTDSEPSISGAFWEGFALAWQSFLDASAVNPWLPWLFGFIIVGGLALNLLPGRRRRGGRSG
jgi:hypothetical protein